jgi:hypothetical protein
MLGVSTGIFQPEGNREDLCILAASKRGRNGHFTHIAVKFHARGGLSAGIAALA